jgi:4-hydroxy-2-oxoheptanedioate aldolase
MARRSFQDLIRLGSALGTWSQIASAEMIDMLGAAGLDFTIIDCEHGAFGIETAENLFRACDANGIVPVVRAPSADAVFIGRALDAGAAAVVVPGIATASQAMAMVAAGRFAPDGTRGACPCVRAGGHFITDWPGYAGRQRVETGVMALVETAEGLSNIEAICAVEGLLALVIGPFDLSVSLGFEGDYRHAGVRAAVDRMLAAAKTAGLPVIAPVFNPDIAEAKRQKAEWQAKGVGLFVIGTDKIIFSDAVSRYGAALRSGDRE